MELEEAAMEIGYVWFMLSLNEARSFFTSINGAANAFAKPSAV